MIRQRRLRERRRQGSGQNSGSEKSEAKTKRAYRKGHEKYLREKVEQPTGWGFQLQSPRILSRNCAAPASYLTTFSSGKVVVSSVWRPAKSERLSSRAETNSECELVRSRKDPYRLIRNLGLTTVLSFGFQTPHEVLPEILYFVASNTARSPDF